jgi:hypothetical protein
VGTPSVTKKYYDEIFIPDHVFRDVNYQRSPSCDLSHLNFLYVYDLIHVTICDPGKLNITMENVRYQGDKEKSAAMITKLEVEPHPAGFQVNDIILPPGVGIEDHLSYRGKVEIDYFNHGKEILTRCRRPRSQDTPLRLDIMTRFASQYDCVLNAKMNDVSLKLSPPDPDDMIKTFFFVGDIVY